MDHISPHSFQEHVRSALFNGGHGFDTKRLNHAENAFNAYLVHADQRELKREHLSDAIRHIEEHPDFKELTPNQQKAYISSLHKTLGVKEETTQ